MAFLTKLEQSDTLVVEESRDVNELPPSSSLRPSNDDASAVSEAFLDLEATATRPEPQFAYGDEEVTELEKQNADDLFRRHHQPFSNLAAFA